MAGEREAADLVEPGRVPRFGDQLRVGEDAVLGDLLDDRRIEQHVPLRVAAEDGGEVESQPVDVHVRDPVLEAAEDDVADDGVVAVDRVAAAGEVQIPALFVKQVEELVVEAAVAVGSAAVVPLAGVIEDDVEDHLDAGLVERSDHVAEFFPLAAASSVRGVGGLRGGERDAVVAPEVLQGLASERVREDAIVLVEFMDG